MVAAVNSSATVARWRRRAAICAKPSMRNASVAAAKAVAA
jgi:hypothetical protein